MSSLLPTPSDTFVLREMEFIGDIMQTTLAYLQENEDENLQTKIRNPPL